MSNSLNPDQARHYVGLDLDPNCLPSLSSNDTRRQSIDPKIVNFVLFSLDEIFPVSIHYLVC